MRLSIETQPTKESEMFNINNTSGFSQDDIALLNEALEIMMENGIAESNAADIVNNNWEPTGNTVDSLTRTLGRVIY
jgi:hypothetical protein